MVTLVGNAATAVEHRQTPTGVPVARFRLASTSRRWDRTRECWTDGDTSFYTVRSWRTLADNVAASVAVGEPLIVQGRLRLREGEKPPEQGGQRWFSAEVDAVAIGHDLSRGTAAFRRAARPRLDVVPAQPGTSGPDPWAAGTGTGTGNGIGTRTSTAGAATGGAATANAATPVPDPGGAEAAVNASAPAVAIEAEGEGPPGGQPGEGPRGEQSGKSVRAEQRGDGVRVERPGEGPRAEEGDARAEYVTVSPPQGAALPTPPNRPSPPALPVRPASSPPPYAAPPLLPHRQLPVGAVRLRRRQCPEKSR
ncbi:single-stranded DNA-binding protein [Streptomyces sp. Pv4-95]|uniref:single-stranded DNA-binding protein n=1 Tax=Streptomyces sp. Pv4-95 TaxID=3049543 RepID=UPI0038917388